jgi:hypothetical protein
MYLYYSMHMLLREQIRHNITMQKIDLWRCTTMSRIFRRKNAMYYDSMTYMTYNSLRSARTNPA